MRNITKLMFILLFVLPIFGLTMCGVGSQEQQDNIIFKDFSIDFLATDSKGLVGARQIGTDLNISHIDIRSGIIISSDLFNMSSEICMGFDWYNNFYILAYVRSGTYEIIVLDDNLAVIEKRSINITFPNNTLLRSLVVDGSDFWVGYFNPVNLSAGVLKLDSELSNVLMNVTLTPPPNYQGSIYDIADMAICEGEILVYDSAFDVYCIGFDGSKQWLLNIYDNNSQFREENNVSTCFPAGITIYNNEICAGMRVAYATNNQKYEGTVFFEYPISQTSASATTSATAAGNNLNNDIQNILLNQLNVIIICGSVVFLLVLIFSKTSLMILSKSQVVGTAYKKELGIKVAAEEMGESTETTEKTKSIEIIPKEPAEIQFPMISDEIINDYEQIENTLNKIRKLMGIRKVGGIAKRYKDKKPRPNFDRSLGILALLGIIIGLIIYGAYRVDIFMSLGMNIGLMISFGGLLASSIMIILWKKKVVEFSKKISLIVLVLSLFLSIYGIFIN
ncbi:MAG: hypothetical protein Q6363_006905, partial [Candidatus Njordarchaeota archaeon]